LACPSLGVAVVGVAARFVGQLRETGLDYPQARAGADGFERELHVGAAWIVGGQGGQPPGEAEDDGAFDTFDADLDGDPNVERHVRGAAWAEVDGRALAEPGGQAVGSGERGPHRGGRMSEVDAALDAVGKAARVVIATHWLQ